MIKKSVSRNQRSKGAKVKHVLQILLLLCICFWLLYQIKRSHDRKRDVIEKDSKALVNGNDEDGGLKLGRKDLHAKRQEEEDDEEGKDEGGQGERDDVDMDEDEIRQELERNEERERQEGQKEEGDEEAVDNHEEEENGREEEEDNNKMDEAEDEREGDNTDLSETMEEVTEVETTDPEEHFLDEDKGGREERINDGVEEDKVDGRREEHVWEDNRSEDTDQDEGENSHEAREVHYREDDASSAVTHNTEADNGNADLELNKPGMESNSTEFIPQDLNRESLEAHPGNKEEGKSNASEVVDNQASKVMATGATELTGLVSNVSEIVTSLPQAQSLTTPDSGSGEVSLEQVTGVKISNASMDEKTANVSAMTNSSNQIDTTPSTSNKEPYKPLDPSNNQTLVVSDGFTSLDKKQDLDDTSKELSTGDVNDNMIKMQLPEKQDEGESRTQ